MFDSIKYKLFEFIFIVDRAAHTKEDFVAICFVELIIMSVLDD